MPATLGSSHEHGSRQGMVLSRRWKRGSGYGIIHSMGNWHTVHGGTFNCPHCGAFYEVTVTRQPSRDRDYVQCECCGNTLAEWDSTSVPGLPVDTGTERRPNARPAELPTNSPMRAVGDGRLVVLCQPVIDERTTRFAR